jgi:hypothetical protein
LNQPDGVAICAVTAFIGSALALVYGAFWVRQLQIVSLSSSRLPFTKEAMLFMALTSLATGAWGVAAAFGLLSHREWARISMLVFGWLCLVFCLLPMLSFPLVPLQHIEGTSVNFNFRVRLFATAYFALFVAIGSWWLYFFSKESVKEQFTEKLERSESPKSSDVPSPKRPLSIRIVAWYLLITAFLFTATFSYRTPVSLLGYSVSGWEARATNVMHVLVHVLAMVGLLELKRWGRTLVIGYFSFLILDTMASAWTPGGRPLFERLVFMAPVSLGLKGLPPEHSLIIEFALAVPLIVMPLWVVVRQKQAFVKAI